MNKRQLFLQHVGQTGPMPVMIDISHAEGIYFWDTEGKKYFDMNSGISVSSLGHCHPAIIDAISKQINTHMHTMVYGEHLQSPQIELAKTLAENLDQKLSSIYFLMAGTEATEAAMKLAKRYTGRTEIIACRNAYHGSTHGAESLRSDESYKSAFYPLLPDIKHIDFNKQEDLQDITKRTACFIIEPVQAEAGVIPPDQGYLEAVRQRCYQTGTLLIFDEIQTGFGRTGHLFAHQKYGVVPDVMLIGKAMGGGMPIAAFVSSLEIMSSLTKNPSLGHITTFGGHPVSCAASKACLDVLLETKLYEQVDQKSQLFLKLLDHDIVQEIRHSGLMMGVELTKRKYLKHVINHALELGLIIDYFLFNDKSFRLVPPLIISEDEIVEACQLIQKALDFAKAQY